jgi:hypothetical protein
MDDGVLKKQNGTVVIKYTFLRNGQGYGHER